MNLSLNTNTNTNTNTHDEGNKKKINILGQGNRYQIKKLVNEKQPNKKRVETNEWNVSQEFLTHVKQFSLLKELHDKKEKKDYRKKDSDIFDLLINQLERKINGYKQQDIGKKVLDKDLIMDLEKTMNQLIHCHMKCFYCRCELFILYETVRENKQWTLDRINNDIGHNEDNVVISCLECNLKRRRKSKESFLFTKQLVIRKTGDFVD